MLYRITTPYYTAGIDTDKDGVVYAAAPIVKWMIGKPIDQMVIYCNDKNFTIEQVE